MSDGSICYAWGVSSERLRSPMDESQRLAIVLNRAHLLDELQRRDPDGFAHWTAGAASMTLDPSRFINSAAGADRWGHQHGEPQTLTLSTYLVEFLYVRSGGQLLDARAGERYRVEVASVDPVPGHVPGAISAPTTENLTGAEQFKGVAELAARLAAIGVDGDLPLAVYCGSGVTAAHEIAALELAGITGVALYPGSYSQWASAPDRPIATGDRPGSFCPGRRRADRPVKVV